MPLLVLPSRSPLLSSYYPFLFFFKIYSGFCFDLNLNSNQRFFFFSFPFIQVYFFPDSQTRGWGIGSWWATPCLSRWRWPFIWGLFSTWDRVLWNDVSPTPSTGLWSSTTSSSLFQAALYSTGWVILSSSPFPLLNHNSYHYHFRYFTAVERIEYENYSALENERQLIYSVIRVTISPKYELIQYLSIFEDN